MTHTYSVSSITCSGCIAKVKSQLLIHPDVIGANVQLEFPQATIEMQRHVSIEELQDAIGKDSKYRISETEDTKAAMPNHDTNMSWFSTYKPLLVIVGYILLVSLLTGKGNSHETMNYFMAGFFLVFSFFKMLDLKGFADSYGMYDLLAKKVPAYSYVYPFIELALGVAFLSGFEPLWTNVVTVIVMSFSSLGVIESVLNKRKIKCACLGAVFNLPMSTVTIIEDVTMVAMAGFGIYFNL